MKDLYVVCSQLYPNEFMVLKRKKRILPFGKEFESIRITKEEAELLIRRLTIQLNLKESSESREERAAEDEIIKHLRSLKTDKRWFSWLDTVGFILDRTNFSLARAVFEDIVSTQREQSSARVQKKLREINEKITKERNRDLY